MTHRAGFEERIKDLVAFDVPDPPLRDVLEGNMPARIYKAGTTSAYSNYATGLAATSWSACRACRSTTTSRRTCSRRWT